MRDAVLKAAADADAVVMAAAVADFRPAGYEDAKIKKTAGAEPRPDLACGEPRHPRRAGPGRTAPGRTAPVVVGFAAETGDAPAPPSNTARQKFARKGCDLLVVNEVGNA